MCVIIAGLGSATPTRQQLTRGCVSNPDGFGWGIVYEDNHGYYTMKWDRTMNGQKAIDGYLTAMSDLGESVAASAFHARITTHGGSVLENCHPFPIGGDERSLLFHNGILPITEQGGRSDTRILAEDILPLMGGAPAVDNSVIYDMVSEWATGSKLVVLSVAEDVEYPLTIINEDEGFWEDELWFSNSSCKPYTAVWSKTGTIKIAEIIDSYDDTCEHCKMDLDPFEPICSTCYICRDCDLAVEECLCYQPASQQAWDMEAF